MGDVTPEGGQINSSHLCGGELVVQDNVRNLPRTSKTVKAHLTQSWHTYDSRKGHLCGRELVVEDNVRNLPRILPQLLQLPRNLSRGAILLRRFHSLFNTAILLRRFHSLFNTVTCPVVHLVSLHRSGCTPASAAFLEPHPMLGMQCLKNEC